jgi:hypothetical protein
MADLNDDLTGGEVNPLAAELREANAKIDQLVQMHRHYTELFARIAQAAGVHLNGSIEGVIDSVITQLNISALTAPLESDVSPPTPAVPGSGLACEVCGNDDAADLGDAVLCRVCSGEIALAEEGRRHG